jgi:hypothetical protein
MAFDTVTRAAPIAAAFRSRLLPILLLLACVTAVSAREPYVVMGLGATSCKAYLGKTPHVEMLGLAVLAWVEGYFSARNVYGHNGRMATVGGTLSADTLESMFKDQCSDLMNATDESVPKPTVYAAADALYQKLEAKGR